MTRRNPRPKESGGHAALPIWIHFMSVALAVAKNQANSSRARFEFAIRSESGYSHVAPATVRPTRQTLGETS
jgi:membrane carboxypeptidase/penicillin-binding protein